MDIYKQSGDQKTQKSAGTGRQIEILSKKVKFLIKYNLLCFHNVEITLQNVITSLQQLS